MFNWDHVHLRPCSFETMFICDHVHLRLCSFETTFIWDHIHLRSHSFAATLKWSCFDLLWITFLRSTLNFFAGDLKFLFCKVTLFRVRSDSGWVVNAPTLWNTAETRKFFMSPAWNAVSHIWNVILLDLVKELHVLSTCFSTKKQKIVCFWRETCAHCLAQ